MKSIPRTPARRTPGARRSAAGSAAKVVPIDRPVQLRALASPLRQELLDVLEAAGPCAIAELGERLGRAPDSLYFHVRRLQKVGLVVEVERRLEGRHAFVVYDVAARPMRIDRRKAKARDMHAVVAGILRLAARDFRRGLSGSGTVVEGAARNHAGARVRGWLDERQLARANEILEELGDLLRAGRPGPGCQPVALAWVLAPVPARRVASRSAHARKRSRGPTVETGEHA
jgi:DNA-binding transcriptional ArsR family regulator